MASDGAEYPPCVMYRWHQCAPLGRTLDVLATRSPNETITFVKRLGQWLLAAPEVSYIDGYMTALEAGMPNSLGSPLVTSSPLSMTKSM